MAIITNKQKVLKILEPHRDMSLTMGCEYKQNDNIFIVDGVVKLVDAERNRPLYRVERQNGKAVLTHFDQILGHPATPLTLLKALGEEYALECTTGVLLDDKCLPTDIKIPLVSTLAEIPESDPLWQAVLDVLI